MDSSSYKIPFVIYVPQYQEQADIRLVGNVDELGNWIPEKAINLVMVQPGIWKVIVSIQGIKEIEWKYFEYKDYKELIWQQGQNNKIKTSLFHDYIQNQAYNCDSFSLMSFNIRYLNYSDGVNYWDNRKKLVFKTITDWRADFIGLQEVVEEQALDIKSATGHKYGSIGRSRHQNPRFGEASPILYDLSKWTCIHDETVWLCDTPKIPGTLCFGSSLPRVVTLGIFFNNYTNVRIQKKILLKECVRIVNTHFDLDEDARLKSIPVLSDTINESIAKHGQMSTFLMGDFNSDRESKVILKILENQQLNLKRLSPHKINTFHGFQGHKSFFNEEIDHIFYSGPDVELLVYDKIQDEGYILDGQNVYCSDHYPIFCIVNKK